LTRPPTDQLEGRRPILEALRAGRPIQELLIGKDLPPVRALLDLRRLARDNGIPVREVPVREIDRLARSNAPQGVIALVPPFRFSSLDMILRKAKQGQEPALLVALDGITDPMNLGALARSAEAAGANGLIALQRRAATVTAAVEKAAAGALAHLPVARVPNLTQAMRDLRKAGLWIVALDGEAPQTIYETELLSEPVCIVVGDEGEGVSRLVRDRADAVVRIPLQGKVGSLNASVAGGIALFEAVRRRTAG
jgi:23S rRNA (guanosine2251-2'-O)-methyltransferase